MKITKTQMNAPFRQDRQKMIQAVVTWWIDNDPSAPMSHSLELLGNMADAAIALANRYGIQQQPEVCAFANLMWLYGPSFDQVEQIHTALSAGTDEETKIEQLYTEIPEACWEEAEARRDDGRWTGILAER